MSDKARMTRQLQAPSVSFSSNGLGRHPQIPFAIARCDSPCPALPVDDPDAHSLPQHSAELFSPIGRWKTHAEFEMRRIVPLKDDAGDTIGYRPSIQQGRGAARTNHSTVFRFSPEMDASTALAAAQRWRDEKELELGITDGAASARSAGKVLPGLSLVVTKSPPYRALWSSPACAKHKRIRIWMGKRTYQEAYNEAVRRFAAAMGLPIPIVIPPAPAPTAEQYQRLQAIGISGLPEMLVTP